MKKKAKKIIGWSLLVILSAPPILSSPLAIFGLDPVKSVYLSFGYPDWLRVFIGFFQLIGGILLLFPKTHRIGWVMLFTFGAIILITKVALGQVNKAFEEIILLILMILFLYIKHPKLQTDIHY